MTNEFLISNYRKIPDSASSKLMTSWLKTSNKTSTDKKLKEEIDQKPKQPKLTNWFKKD